MMHALGSNQTLIWTKVDGCVEHQEGIARNYTNTGAYVITYFIRITAAEKKRNQIKQMEQAYHFKM